MVPKNYLFQYVLVFHFLWQRVLQHPLVWLCRAGLRKVHRQWRHQTSEYMVQECPHVSSILSRQSGGKWFVMISNFHVVHPSGVRWVKAFLRAHDARWNTAAAWQIRIQRVRHALNVVKGEEVRLEKHLECNTETWTKLTMASTGCLCLSASWHRHQQGMIPQHLRIWWYVE